MIIYWILMTKSYNIYVYMINAKVDLKFAMEQYNRQDLWDLSILPTHLIKKQN